MKKIKVIPIGSGSSGNCMYLELGKYKLLIDMGISCLRTRKALNFNNVDFADIDAALLTHNHSDHIGGLNTISKALNVPIIMSELAGQYVDNGKLITYDYGQRVEILKDLFVTLFYVSHDAEGTCGFTFEYLDTKVSYATDIGEINDSVIDYMKGSDLIVLESNHNKEMLKQGPYPEFLKRRIKSKKGHLSNDECGKAIKLLSTYGTKYFFLAHLSKENNTPELAIREVSEIVNDSSVKLLALPIYSNEMIDIII